jgi:penicillin-binding protein 1A
MARRRKERQEPLVDIRAVGPDGALEFGLNEGDRATGRARGSRAARARAAAGGKPPRREKPARKKRARGSRGGSGGGLVQGAVRRLVRFAVAVVLLCVIGVGGLVAFYAAKLPPASTWTVPERPPTVRILAENGALITMRGEQSGEALTLDEMPPYLPEAVIAIEDRRFYHHFGVDPIGLVRALVTNFRAGGVVQGGSTITQQLAKNLFLKPERTFERKVQEVILALWLEQKLTKKRILELYLNRVYLGAGAYGVDAASLRYFGKSARQINLAEAATLAGLLKAPGRYSPAKDPAAAEARAQVVLTAMRQAGYITDRQASLAMSVEVKPIRDVAGGSGRYVADWIMDILPGFVGAVDEDITVDTTIDLPMQVDAARAVASVLDAEGKKYGVSQGALVAIDPSGAVRAMVGGRDYGASPYNRAVAARRQPGSAFKPFVYLTALEHGLSPETVRVDQPVSIRGWTPKNYSKEYLGPVRLSTALALSLNTVSAQLTAEVGPAAVVATAHRLGITSPLQATPSIALGTSEVSLLELTGAFAPFANGGRGVIPHVIKRITNADGKVLYEREGSGPGQVVDPRYVGMMNAMLRQVLESGTGKRAAIAGWPAAGKTGTSQDFRDAWFVGYTANLVAGLWFGNDSGRPTKKASGSNLPSLAWHQFMTTAMAGLPVADLPGNYNPALAAGSIEDLIPPGEVGEDYGSPSGTFPDVVPAGRGVQRPASRSVDAEGPVPPGDIGGSSPSTRPASLFKRLFGG